MYVIYAATIYSSFLNGIQTYLEHPILFIYLYAVIDPGMMRYTNAKGLYESFFLRMISLESSLAYVFWKCMGILRINMSHN
jgi:hypothetical protein